MCFCSEKHTNVSYTYVLWAKIEFLNNQMTEF
jgi:hypothetical protein